MDNTSTNTTYHARISANNLRGYSIELEDGDLDPDYYTNDDNISAEEFIVDWFRALVYNTDTSIDDFIASHNIAPNSSIYCELCVTDEEGESTYIDDNMSIEDIKNKI